MTIVLQLTCTSFQGKPSGDISARDEDSARLERERKQDLQGQVCPIKLACQAMLQEARTIHASNIS